MNFTALYGPTILGMALAGFLLLLQLIVADVAAIRAGNKPGHPIPADSSAFIFRSARAHANTNESIAAFMLFAVAGMLASASPYWLNILSLAYLGCRAGHMAAYYAGLNLVRSIFFGVSLLVLLGMFVAVLRSF
jgi:uncharacterized MAPEG superfamily protein